MATEPDLARLYGEDYFRGMTAHVRRIDQFFRHIPFKPGDQVCEFGCGLGVDDGVGIGRGSGADFTVIFSRLIPTQASKIP